MNGKERYAVVLETVDGERRVTCGRDEFIWDAAARGGIALPAICHQGRCLTCAGRLLSGEVDQSRSNQYLAQDKQAGFVLLCTAQPRSDVRILTDQQWSMREHRRKRAYRPRIRRRENFPAFRCTMAIRPQSSWLRKHRAASSSPVVNAVMSREQRHTHARQLSRDVDEEG